MMITEVVLNQSNDVLCVRLRQLWLRAPANACESFEQPLPLASDELRSKFSAMWFEVMRSFMAFSVALW